MSALNPQEKTIVQHRQKPRRNPSKREANPIEKRTGKGRGKEAAAAILEKILLVRAKGTMKSDRTKGRIAKRASHRRKKGATKKVSAALSWGGWGETVSLAQ